MSLKPPKKSDLGKTWMSKRRDSRRKIKPEYHLIVTEGTDTEPQYFEAIKSIINETCGEHVQLEIHGQGDNTLSLFRRAMALANQSLNGYRHIWVVYDTDDFPPEHINSVVDYCEAASTEERTFHAIRGYWPLWAKRLPLSRSSRNSSHKKAKKIFPSPLNFSWPVPIFTVKGLDKGTSEMVHYSKQTRAPGA